MTYFNLYLLLPTFCELIFSIKIFSACFQCYLSDRKREIKQTRGKHAKVFCIKKIVLQIWSKYRGEHPYRSDTGMCMF